MSSSSVFGTAAAPVSIGGLESGLNTSSIISALTQNENTAITNYQNQQTALNTQLTAWQTFNGDLVGLQSIASSLQNPSSFTTAQANIDQTSVATVTANTGALVGNHTLTVTGLASAQQVLSNGLADPTVPLNVSGSFLLNGKTVTLTATDTLNSAVKKINAAGAGVTASVIQASAGNNQISLTSSATGGINAISASDLNSDTALEQLGLIPSSGQTTGLRQSVTLADGHNGGAGSISFANSTQPIATLEGMTGTPPSGSVTIGGTSVNIDLSTMSLTDISNAINSAGISGVQARIAAVPDSSGNITSTSPKQLQIVSTNGTALTSSSFTDSGGVLSALGITQTSFTTQKSQASDSAFTLDGVNYTRSSNAVTNAIPNVTINLLSTNNSSTSTPANIGISQNTSAITTSIQNFATAYNGINDYINQQNTYSGPTSSGTTVSSTPPLFGSYTLTAVQNQMASMMDVASGGLTMASIGITVNSTGDLQLNSTTLSNQLQSNPTAVAGLFGTSGTTTGSNLTYSSSIPGTKPSPSGGYTVNITAASQATVTGSTVYSPPSSAETLSFSSGFFGSSGTSVTLAAGTTLANAITQINSDGNLSQFVYASQDNTGHLVISSKGYGSNQQFNVSSNLTAASGSGIGTVNIGASGKDVKGTIDGEPASGLGTSLIGIGNNTNTPGLQLSYTGTALGNVGTVTITDGASDLLSTLISSVTNSTTGAIANQENSVNAQITSIGTEITNLQTEVANYSAQLTTEFNNMETALATLKSQQSALTAELNGGTSSTSSNSNSSSSSSTGSTSSSSTA